MYIYEIIDIFLTSPILPVTNHIFSFADFFFSCDQWTYISLIMGFDLFTVGISQATGMDPHDIAATLQLLNMIQKRDGK